MEVRRDSMKIIIQVLAVLIPNIIVLAIIMSNFASSFGIVQNEQYHIRREIYQLRRELEIVRTHSEQLSVLNGELRLLEREISSAKRRIDILERG